MKLVLDFLLITGILSTALILLVLFLKKEKEFPHKVLIAIFIPILIVFLSYYSFLHKIGILFYLTFLVSSSLDSFIGPLIFIYVKGIIGENTNRKNNYKHFIFPVICFFSISIPALIDMLYEAYDFTYLTTLQPLLLFTITYSLGYCISAFSKLKRFQKLVKLNYSNLEFKNLEWVKHLLIGAIIICSISVITSIYEVNVGDMGWDIDFITIIPIVALVMYLGYYGISQSTILIPQFLRETNTGDSLLSMNTTTTNTKYSYDVVEMENLSSTLIDLMTTNKPFLDEDLTLTTLAKLLEVPDKKLSTLLNQNMNTSFYDYVNRFRVDEVIKMMSSPEGNKYTLLALAFDCGFKSKSSFNRVFKKTTKLSPSEYRKQVI